jgi:hypothetical protein
MKKEKRAESRTGWRWATAIALCLSLFTGIVVSEGARAQTKSREDRSVNSLTKYTTDLTAAAEAGQFNSIEVPAESTNRAIEILAGDTQNNPVVISDSQSVRDMVIVGVAMRISRGEVPEALKSAHLHKLDLNTLFHDSKTADELVNKINAIVAELSQSDAKAILIIDPIQSLIGPSGAFNGAASQLLRDALQNSQVRCFGASTEAAFAQNIASDQTLAPIFSIVATEAAAKTDDSAEAAKSGLNEEFVGDKVSPELREMLASGDAPARVKAVIQVNDANSATLRKQLSEYGIKIDSELARFGALTVDMPTKAIEKLADSGAANYLSLDRAMTGLGHVEQTTGDDAMLGQYGNAGFDGSSIGVAILDSGISTKYKSLAGSVVYSRDFTGEGTTDDPYGHGTFVASMIATKRGSYGGVAPGASLVNFRVLNSKGEGQVSWLLSALDAVLANRGT